MKKNWAQSADCERKHCLFLQEIGDEINIHYCASQIK